MSVRVKWFPTLVRRTRSKQPETVVEWRDGLTALDVFLSEGFSPIDAEAVMVVVNDAQVSRDARLADGDRVDFMVSIQGGSGVLARL